MEPLDLVRDWYAQMNNGDIAGAAAKLHPEIEWIEAEHSPYGRPGQGLIGVAAINEAVWSTLARDWTDLRVVPEEFIPAASTVVVIARYSGTHTRSGGELDAQALHVWTVRDDKIARYRGFADTYALRSAVADVASLPPAPVGQAEQHKAATGLVFDVWNSGNVELLDQVVASDVIHHDRYDPNAADGLHGMKATIQRERETFPDLNITVEDQIADEDRVTTRWTAAMTHQRTLSGEPLTGRAVTLPGITIDRFEDGKIVEAWRSRDTLHLLRQIGAVTRTTS
ncbi:MAG: ester cyclase [Acidimicrobiales bacterium]